MINICIYIHVYMHLLLHNLLYLQAADRGLMLIFLCLLGHQRTVPSYVDQTEVYGAVYRKQVMK